MFEITQNALEVIKKKLGALEKPSPLRIALIEASWAGQTLGMVLDEPKDADIVFHENGLTYLMDKGFFESVKPIKIDLINTDRGSEFSVSSVGYRFNFRLAFWIEERCRKRGFIGLDGCWKERLKGSGRTAPLLSS